MKNAIRYGLIIGIVSGVWIFIMHFAGTFDQPYPGTGRMSWLEYLSVIIPFAGLYLGIKNFRNTYNGGTMEFFEGLFEGIKILLVGGLITAFVGVLYFSYVSNPLKFDYMNRVAGAGIVGILFTVIIALMLMNKQRNL